jgi:hypothetical protein
MDVKTLVVGQNVRIESGIYGREGKVVRITPSGAEVQTGVMQNDGTWNAHELLRFDNEGRGCDESDDTRECGPWYIRDENPK